MVGRETTIRADGEGRPGAQDVSPTIERMLSRPRLPTPSRVLAAVTATLCLSALSACGSEQDGQGAATDPASSAAASPSEEASTPADQAAGSCDYPSDGTPPATIGDLDTTP